MILNVLGVDPSFRNFGMVLAELDTDSMSFKIKDMHIAQTSEEKIEKSKSVIKDGKRILKKVKVRPDDVRKNADDMRRAKILYDAFHDFVKRADIAIAEIPVGSQDSRAMASYGVCLGVLASCPIPLIQVTPTEVKMVGTGESTATKDEMIEAAVAKFPDAPWLTRRLKGEIKYKSDNEHLADATFTIEAGLRTTLFQEMAMKFGTTKTD